MLELISVPAIHLPENSERTLQTAYDSLSKLEDLTRFLPALTSSTQDVPLDYYRRLIYLSRISPVSVDSPFTFEHETAIKKSVQAARNTSICLRCGCTTFLLFSSFNGLSSCLALTALSQKAQAIIACVSNTTNTCILSELGLQYGGRNTNGSSDSNNAKQDAIAELTKEYTQLGKFLIRLSMAENKSLNEFSKQVATAINVDTLREKALSFGTTQQKVDEIFKFFQGSVAKISGIPWSNFEVDEYVALIRKNS